MRERGGEHVEISDNGAYWQCAQEKKMNRSLCNPTKSVFFHFKLGEDNYTWERKDTKKLLMDPLPPPSHCLFFLTDFFSTIYYVNLMYLYLYRILI